MDCRWREQRLTVELDSYRYHTPATRGSRTDAASARLGRGDESRRYTYGDVFEIPSSCSPSSARCSARPDGARIRTRERTQTGSTNRAASRSLNRTMSIRSDRRPKLAPALAGYASFGRVEHMLASTNAART